MTFSRVISRRYARRPGDPDKAFRALCALLAGRTETIDWPALTPADWELFSHMAGAEGVAPMAHYLLRGDAETRRHVPSGTLERLRRSFLHTAARNLVLFNELDRVVAALSEAGIPAALLKGAHLARSIYPDITLRPMGDLDVLVRQEHFQDALAAVQELGYTQHIPEIGAGLHDLLDKHAHLHGADGQGILELHWRLVSGEGQRFAFDEAWWWANAEPCRSAAPALALNPTANLVYLCAHHMLQHGSGSAPLRWIYDLHRLVLSRGAGIDWAELAARAEALGWGPAILAGLELSAACFDTPLPVGLLASLRARSSPGVDRLVALKSSRARTRMIATLRKLTSMGWGAGLRLALALVFPAPAYMKWRYRPNPAWTWPLYYPYRWWDVFWDGVKSVTLEARS